MKVRLELVHQKAKIKKVLLKSDTVIGRSTECGLRIASNEVSRQHCKICLGQDGVTVRDLGSSNGTFVNGYELEPDTDYEIAPDSELSLGGIKFYVRFNEPVAKLMQSDGYGSTVDLKPGNQEESADEELPVSEADENPADAEPPEDDADESTGTVEVESPADANAAIDPADFEMSTHGDSAILEREEGDSPKESREAETEADAEFPEETIDQDTSAPETAEVKIEDQNVDEEDSGDAETGSTETDSETAEPQDQPADSDSKTSESGEEEDVASFLNQVSEGESDDDDDPSLGDFFKQFD